MILINNVEIFNGINQVEENSLIIENNLIKEVGKNLKSSLNLKKIDGNGNFLIPGFLPDRIVDRLTAKMLGLFKRK